jgi:ATP-dependent DNA helicase DinG
VGSLVESDQIVEGIETAGKRLGDVLRDHEGRLRRGPPADVAEALATGRARLVAALEALRNVDDKLGADVATRKARVTNAVTALVTDLDAFTTPRADDVVWVDELGGEHRLQLAPLDVGLTLDRLLWDPPDTGLAIAAAGPTDPEDDPRYGLPTSVVLTSATIPVGLARQLHLDPAVTDELDVGTPFDFHTQGLLYCAAHLPDPRKEQYADAMLEELAALIEAAGGRTLALFTSHRMLRLAADRLTDEIDHEVLVQGDRPKGALIEAFATDETSCLFATMGYWQGIDVPGAACSLVTIDRIPFPRPDEPIWQARREAAGAAAFKTIDVPRAATLLAQGAGRLIRNSTDRGVVAVLDPRLATNKSYRWELVAALPPMRRTRDITDVVEFLAQ